MKRTAYTMLWAFLFFCQGYSQFYPLRKTEEKTIYSTVLKEQRPILISKPIGYDHSSEAYFVVYVLDGNLNMSLTSGIAELLYQAGYPKLLIVGIPSTERTRDLTPSAVQNTPLGGGADDFMRFIETELMPYVAHHYRAHTYKALIGHSLGGLFATHVLHKNPDLFDGYIAITPTVVYEDFQTGNDLRLFFEGTKVLNKTFFFSVAYEPGPEGDAVFRLKREVFEKRTPDQFEWAFEYYPKENHSTTPVVATLDGLRFVFKDLVPGDDLVKEKGFENTLLYYRKLGEKYFKEVLIPQRVLMNYGYDIIDDKDLEKEAFAVFNYYREKYPGVPVSYDGLAILYERRNDLNNAIRNLKKLIEIDPSYEDALDRLEKLEKIRDRGK